MIRYLEKSEYKLALELSKECFDDAEESHFERDIEVVGDFEGEKLTAIICYEDFTDKISGELLDALNNYYLKDIERPEGAGKPKQPSIKTAYLSYICTVPLFRHQGKMKSLMEFTLSSLKEKNFDMAILIPVDEKIYEGLGFETIATIEDKALLDEMEVDDGLDTCMVSRNPSP